MSHVALTILLDDEVSLPLLRGVWRQRCGIADVEALGLVRSFRIEIFHFYHGVV